MLNETQKKAVRLLIEKKPQAEYMTALASDDNYALEEIKANAPAILAFKQEVIANNIAQKEAIERELFKLYADIEILNSVLEGNE